MTQDKTTEQKETKIVRSKKILMDQDSLEAQYGIAAETVVDENSDVVTFRAQVRDVATGKYILVPTKVQSSILIGALLRVRKSGKTVAYVYAYGKDLPEVLRAIHYIRNYDMKDLIVSESSYSHVALKGDVEVQSTESGEVIEEYSTYLHGLQIELLLS
jgi:hypothetical protein